MSLLKLRVDFTLVLRLRKHDNLGWCEDLTKEINSEEATPGGFWLARATFQIFLV